MFTIARDTVIPCLEPCGFALNANAYYEHGYVRDCPVEGPSFAWQVAASQLLERGLARGAASAEAQAHGK